MRCANNHTYAEMLAAAHKQLPPGIRGHIVIAKGSWGKCPECSAPVYSEVSDFTPLSPSPWEQAP